MCLLDFSWGEIGRGVLCFLGFHGDCRRKDSYGYGEDGAGSNQVGRNLMLNFKFRAFHSCGTHTVNFQVGMPLEVTRVVETKSTAPSTPKFFPQVA